MEQLHHFKRVLEERKREIGEILEKLKGDLVEVARAEILDEGDYASLSQERDREEKLYIQLKNELGEIELALIKIEQGNYGICEMCEEPIEIDRLKVKPFARYCIECRRIIEKEQQERS